MDHARLVASLRLARSRNIGPVAYHHLIQRFGSAEAALEALPDLASRAGKKQVIIAKADDIEREIDSVQRLGAQHVVSGGLDYPPLLSHMENPPPVLIVAGDTSLASRPTLAMVGARNSSAAARKLAFQLASGVAEQGIVTVSGLARGIDTQAHQGAIQGSHDVSAMTIAVIASGIDLQYPPENADLQRTIAEIGLLITEYPPGTEPLARHFPFRNRIIAGLSYATLVVEAAPRSGSLITARLANEQGREVLAIPGSPLDKRSEGCNGLIREGATLVRNVDDILEALANIGDVAAVADSNQAPAAAEPRLLEEMLEPTLVPTEAEPPIAIDPEDIASDHDRISAHLSFAPITVNDLAVLSEMAVERVQAVLVELEITGQLTRLAGGKVQRAESD
ncbi:DNA-processing protein DprA [Alterisphingorhabdus coralli]|uniref:DNA-processing protein DprA n=1 Tax=Alterisphingorhabdus coralli TaxID=3071408 RepID=A0AA97I2U4_9SPHN|nr:DNA-processing protein DprA [Parasphingorhabdus sp. SCSIO 66989]WOE76623.1 DNA-processing protein DprA [Parasphingorhabdus sp. SCSIO 66989]